MTHDITFKWGPISFLIITYKYNTNVYNRGQYRRLFRIFRQFDLLYSIMKFFFHRISLM